MVIVFNIYAIGQLIIAGLVAGVVHLIMAIFGYSMIGGTREAFVTLLIIAAVSAITDVYGMKGRLFFIPVWIFALLLAIVTCHYADHGLVAFTFLYLGIVGVVMLFYYAGRKRYIKTWDEKKHILELTKTETGPDGLNQPLFWRVASQLYYHPGTFFLYGYPLWKIIYKDAINRTEFLNYYKDFLDMLPADLDYSDYPAIQQMKEKVEQGLTSGNYHHPSAALQHLADLIDKKNGASAW